MATDIYAELPDHVICPDGEFNRRDEFVYVDLMTHIRNVIKKIKEKLKDNMVQEGDTNMLIWPYRLKYKDKVTSYGLEPLYTTKIYIIYGFWFISESDAFFVRKLLVRDVNLPKIVRINGVDQYQIAKYVFPTYGEAHTVYELAKTFYN